MCPKYTHSRRFFSSISITSITILVLVKLVIVQEASGTDQHQYPHNFNYTINHADHCNSSQNIKLLIMVHTAGGHFASRLTIRRTWGSVVKRRDVRLLFLLGDPSNDDLQRHILEEDSTFGDIIQEAFWDTYNNLTLKTIMMVKWATTYCPNARYVLKIDDDCFLNPDAMLAFLDQNLIDVAIYGRVWRNYKPHRKKSSKWYMPFDTYPQKTYPDFAAGPSYMLTQKAVPLLYEAVLTIRPIYLEDVYLNGICAEKAKIPRIDNSGFYVEASRLQTVDFIRKKVLTSHEFPHRILSLLWWLLYDTRGSELNSVLVKGH